MLAPKTGTELREDLSNTAHRAAEKIQAAAEQVSEQAKSIHAQIAEHKATVGPDAVAVDVEGDDEASEAEEDEA
jgi:gas vesicle protein